MTGRPLLLVEDTPSLQLVYESVLRSAGHEVQSADDAASGLAAFKLLQPPVVLLDLMLPDRDGLDLMREFLSIKPDTHVIVITANGSINKAVAAMRAGAHEFLVKPFDEQRFLNAIDNALAGSGPVAVSSRKAATPGEFIGESEPMRQVYAKIGSVARSMATVFITGESGTGKELCAQAVHDMSNRAQGPFVPLNCGAIPSELLESEVFGHVKGSFTGAISDKPGAAAAADGGTLFLDEICELDLNLQTKLLRFLQTSTIQPVGATRSRKVNVRIVCATNRDPLQEVRRGRFREDLYYRLHVVPIHMPPLRDRGTDVVTIAEAALARFAHEEGRRFRDLDPDVKTLFRALDWPGNVRQLLNVMRHVVVLNDGPTVTRAMLPIELHHELENAAGGKGSVPPPQVPLEGLVGRTLAEIERLVIEETIARHGGSVPKAARVLDVSPSTLYRKIESWKPRR
ncbi:MAG: sigma-54-dependent Fis family transcriptional regulator [Rhodobacterales bacterium 32-67-9]|nr:MAG: sigma-54-dependent Fis family transcriptional regulator [Rhodobacterales bacterium 32-67-9]